MSLRKILIAITVGAIASNASAISLFIEKPREKMPEFVMPKSNFSQAAQNAIADSDPRTRQMLNQMIKARQGFEWKNTEDGARQHIEYKSGVYGLSKAQETTLLSYANDLPAYSQIVVIGYADDKGTASKNKELAMKRAQKVKDFLLAQRNDLDVTSLHSVVWPGDPMEARRTDVLHIVQRTLTNND